MSDTLKPPTGYFTWCDYLIYFDFVGNGWNMRGEYRDYTRAELAKLRRTVKQQEAEIGRLREYVERLYLCNEHAIPGPCTCDWTTC